MGTAAKTLVLVWCTKVLRKMRLKGKYHIDNAKAPQEMIKGLMTSPTGQILAAILGFPTYIPSSESGLVSQDFEYPAHFQAGIKYKVMPDLQVNFDIGSDRLQGLGRI